jgi:hypothetical protein
MLVIRCQMATKLIEYGRQIQDTFGLREKVYELPWLSRFIPRRKKRQFETDYAFLILMKYLR